MRGPRKKKPTFTGITLEIARKHLEDWLEAELEITTHQSYRLGNESLTMADLDMVGRRIEYWRQMVARLEKMEQSRGRNRIYHVVPRDF